VKKGEKDAGARAGERWKKLLASYQEPKLAPAVDDELKDFVARRKRTIEATID
jgi:trimethylamine--corrinoid protein Co-methyltransferase